MPDYTTTNLIILCVLGLIIKLFFSGKVTRDGLSGPASSTMWGYGISAISIFFLSFINFANSSKGDSDNSLSFMLSFVTSTLPSIFTLLILMYIIWLNITYFKRINQGNVAAEFYSMSKMSTVLLFFQIFTLFKSIHSMSKKGEDGTQSDNGGNESGIIYLLTLINVIFIIILNIILEYFSTDN